MRKIISMFFIVFVLNGPSSHAEEPEDLPEVRIYFIPWDIAFQSMPTTEFVRQNYFVKTEILDGYLGYGYLQNLGVKDLRKLKNPEPVNVRLVIDFIYLHTTKTYISDGEKLYDSEGVMGKNVNEAFRKRFEVVPGGFSKINLPIRHGSK